ncbi:probable disease resistance protein At4g14610 [Hibiscus syriacus]|uniref:probable disease resistance protein At4g14610 n=1 Tax=Hibiscus syriacus TaxID=106335 RepID=UPI001924BDBC|nr:probable disease resistance protein At4g14610 [Hibiscus syriacus]
MVGSGYERLVEEVECFADLNVLTIRVYDCEDLEQLKIERAEIASAGCFRSVTFVKLARCPKLKDATRILFVPLLVKLAIHECQDLEEVIGEDKLDEVVKLTESSNVFSELEAFDLQKLPKLKTIYMDALPFPMLKEGEICCKRKCVHSSFNTKHCGVWRWIKRAGEDNHLF